MTGISRQANTTGTAADGVRVEIGHLEKDISCVFTHRGTLAPHDAGHANGSFGVGDEQHVGLGTNGLTIEQRDGLHAGRPRGLGVISTTHACGAREAYVDAPPNLREVVRMHWLPQLEQHVVRNVNDRTD